MDAAAVNIPDMKRYTYAEYLTWGDDVRYELIDGAPYLMACASQAHQAAVGGLFAQLYAFLRGKPCKVFVAPFDVRLNAESFDDTVVQPDILVVYDETKLDGKSYLGAPDMVVEVLSETSAKHDKIIKMLKYQKAGVREYWMADPERKIVDVYLLRYGRYVVFSYGETDTVKVDVLKRCKVNLADVFAG